MRTNDCGDCKMKILNRKIFSVPRARVREGVYAAGSVLIVILLMVWISRSGGRLGRQKSESDGGNAKISTAEFTDPAVKNSRDLVLYARRAAQEGWGYVYGTCGQVLSDELLASRQKAYPDEVTPYLGFIEQNWMGRRVADCAGLIKGYGWLQPQSGAIVSCTNGVPDLSADGLYRAAAKKGSISALPELPGVAVWQDGHVGVYAGNGKVIEAMTTTRGVTETDLNKRGWIAWFQVPGIRYAEPEQKTAALSSEKAPPE